MIRIISIVKSWVSAARAFNLWSIYFYWACLMLRWFICYYAYLTIPRSTSQHTSPHLSVTVSVFIHEKLSNENKRTSEHHNWLIIPWHCWLVVAVRCQCWDTGTRQSINGKNVITDAITSSTLGPSIPASPWHSHGYIFRWIFFFHLCAVRGMWYCDTWSRVAWLTLECSRKIGHSEIQCAEICED